MRARPDGNVPRRTGLLAHGIRNFKQSERRANEEVVPVFALAETGTFVCRLALDCEILAAMGRFRRVP